MAAEAPPSRPAPKGTKARPTRDAEPRTRSGRPTNGKPSGGPGETGEGDDAEGPQEPGQEPGEEEPPDEIASPGADLKRVEVGLSAPAAEQQSYRAISDKSYVLGPYDKLQISLIGLKPEQWEAAVSPQGTIPLPLVGAVRCGGLSVGRLEQALAAKLKRYFRDFSLSVTVTEVRGIQVSITGQVAAPGSYSLSGLTPVWQAIQTAGGITPAGSVRSVRIRSQEGKEKSVDLYPFLFAAAGEGNPPLETGDTVIVPVAERVVGLAGEVRRPGLYEFRQGETLARLLALAGGATAQAALDKAYIERAQPDQTRQIAPVDLAAGTRTPSPELRDGDILVLPPLSVYMGRVEVKGEVRVPGSYECKADMRLRDLLHLAGGHKATAALARTYVERYEGNQKAHYIWKDAARALAGDEAANILLQEGDVVHVPAVTTFAGRVEVRGEVREPTTQPLGEGMTVRDLIRVAGGLTGMAAQDHAYIERVDGPGGQKRLLWIDAAKALEGSVEDNKPLCDSDLLVIPPKREYYGQVSVTGELRALVAAPVAETTRTGLAMRAGADLRVAEAQTLQFDLSEGMRVSDLVKLAGGPTATAALEHARLVRIRPGGLQEAATVDLRTVLAGVGGAQDLVLRDGDSLRVPSISVLQKTVRVSGELVGTGLFQTVTDASGATVTKRRGNYELKEGDTVRDLVVSVGGSTPNANLRAARIERRGADGKSEIIPVDLHRLLVEKDQAANVALENGDEFVVPAIADMVYIVGAVARPGAYEYREGNNRVIDMLNRAGGATPRAVLSRVRVIRSDAGPKQKPIPVDMKAVLKRGHVERDPGLRPGDIVVVPEKLATYQDVVQVLTMLPLLRYYLR